MPNIHKRSQIISDFYKITKDKIEVFPEKLTTLQDEYGQTLEVATVKQLILDKFSEMVDTVETLDPSQYDKDQIQKSNERIKAQNEKYLSL